MENTAQLSPFSKAIGKFLIQSGEQSDYNEIISNNEFGFRSNHKTFHPILVIKSFIEKELQNKNHIILVTLALTQLKLMDFYKIKLNIIQRVIV